MQHFDNARLIKTIIHQVGNKSREEGTKLSQKPLVLEESLQDLLLHYFLAPFKQEEYFRFHHPTELGMNEIWQYITQLFDEPHRLTDISQKIAKHLYEQSVHPKVKSGELYITLFDDCLVEDELTQAIGIFKAENKDRFIKVYPSGQDFEIGTDEGVNINKLDKGCIIFNLEQDQGYLLMAVDHSGKGEAAKYWKEDFLGIKYRQDDYHFTQDVLKVASDFVKERVSEEFETEEKDKIGLMQRSLDYFHQNDVFDVDNFKTEVFDTPELQDSFTQYTVERANQDEIVIPERFEIADQAVKRSRKFFKSVLKLDKNFHVYVHGNPERMEKGFDDEQKLQYYKLFFEEEL